MDHVTAGYPSAVSVWLYALWIIPFDNDAVVIDGGRPITNENCLVSSPAKFDALTVKVNVPYSAGVPDITPADDSDRPFGMVPDSSDHVGVGSPAAASV
jgi:hypothetical protein